jgi:hypothetical protein
MWVPDGQSVDPSFLGDFQPETTLYEYDAPLVFTCRDDRDGLLLAYNLLGERDVLRFLVVAVDATILAGLTSGRTDIIGALRQPRTWIVDVAQGWRIQRAWSTEFARIPADCLPKPGVMLWPSLDSLSEARLSGENDGLGTSHRHAHEVEVDRVQ